MKGELIKIAIKAHGKTQEEVADLIGISREWFGKLLKGELKPAYVEKIKRLGISLDHLSEQNENLLDIENRYLKTRIQDLEGQIEDLRALNKTLNHLLTQKSKPVTETQKNVKTGRV